MRCCVVFCEDTGAVVGGEEEDSIDGEEGEIGRHVSRIEKVLRESRDWRKCSTDGYH